MGHPAENRAHWADRLDHGADSIDMSLSTLYPNALFSVHADPEAAMLETWEARVAAMQMHHAFFMLTTSAPGTEPELMVDHKVRRPVAPERAGFGSPEVLDMIVFPQMGTFLQLVRRDTENFDNALVRSLDRFRAFQTADPRRTRDVSGVVPLGLLSLVFDTDRHDPDFRMEVESGYLPEHLAQAGWHGEFPLQVRPEGVPLEP